MTAVDIITMGCSKNLVDSEQLIARFASRGFKVYHNPDETHGGIVVVNTCGFIAAAKEESINTILELCEKKNDGELQRVYVMGCLSERYMKELQDEIPEVDKFYGKFNWGELIEEISANKSLTPQPSVSEERGSTPEDAQVSAENSSPAEDASLVTCTATPTRAITTPSHYAYIKISEGCDRHCAYCAIPIITGRHTSRPMEEILDEVRALVAQGVKEFQVIAQELTYYGVDLYGQQRIAELVDAMAQIEGVEWIRLHYAYPTHFPTDLLRVMRERPNVCNYLDIALQHISDHMLSRMQRHITKQETLALLEQMRRDVPGICIRTTLMVGFPGETDEDFEELMDFVRTVRFDRMGAFAYSEEEGTYAALHYADDVPEEVKQERLDRLMTLQEIIAAELSEEKVGRTLRVVLDRCEGDYYIGRTEADSPEVDCEVLIPVGADERLEVGAFYDVRITDCEEFDLYGEIAHEQ